MKQFIKKYLKIIIGIMVLLLVLFVFVQTQKTTSLETGTLKDWRSASIARRENAVKILTATDDNLNLLVACVDKMAGLPDSSHHLPFQRGTVGFRTAFGAVIGGLRQRPADHADLGRIE